MCTGLDGRALGSCTSALACSPAGWTVGAAAELVAADGRLAHGAQSTGQAPYAFGAGVTPALSPSQRAAASYRRQLLDRQDGGGGGFQPGSGDRDAGAVSVSAGTLVGLSLMSLGGCGILLFLVWRVGEWLVARQRRRAGYVEMQEGGLRAGASSGFNRPWADAGE